MLTVIIQSYVDDINVYVNDDGYSYIINATYGDRPAGHGGTSHARYQPTKTIRWDRIGLGSMRNQGRTH